MNSDLRLNSVNLEIGEAQLGNGLKTVVPPAPPEAPRDGEPPELSIVMPCLNEAGSVGACVEKSLAVLQAHGIQGEVVVSDNGSTDGSAEIARRAGARVVHQPLRGYGHAYMHGFDSARGQYILMADSDNTYDFNELPRFVDLLRGGHDLVMGNRFAGRILPGAMPWSHRYLGNPVLSGLLNLFFHTGIGDAHCGMRAFSREAYARMRLQTGGMEFASEMVINAAKAGLRMTEVPITYFPREGQSKLQSLRDGWRHLRFMLLYSPTHLYLWPGSALMALGLLALLVLARGPVRLDGFTFGFQWMFIGSLFALLGFQLIHMGFFARVYSLSSHLDGTHDPTVRFFTRHFKMETGVLAGALLFGAGISTYLFILVAHFNDAVDLLQSTRLSVLALTLSVLGAQTVFASFFTSMMVIKRGGWPQ